MTPLRQNTPLSAGPASASSRKVRLCGVFGHVLFPQDKEGFGSINIARRKWFFIFEESTYSACASLVFYLKVANNYCVRNKCCNLYSFNTSEGNTRRLLP